MEKIGKYEIIEELGKGGMGIVYKGRDPFLGRNVAIKVLNEITLAIPEFNKRFIREARAAGNINHENITTVYDAGEDGGRLYIVMEYLEGRELRDIIEIGETISLEKKLAYAIQTCKGLKKAHDSDIIHRDVKPSNIFVTRDDVVKIMDFGVAGQPVSDLTMTNASIGTPHYMSPEQVKGARADKQSDIFSFGVVLYELLTSKRPFDGTSIESILYRIVNTTPDQIAIDENSLGKAFYEIVLKCLAKEPKERYQDLGEVITALENVTMSTQMAGTTVSPFAKTVPFRREPDGGRKSRFPLGPKSGAALLIGLIGVFLLIQNFVDSSAPTDISRDEPELTTAPMVAPSTGQASKQPEDNTGVDSTGLSAPVGKDLASASAGEMALPAQVAEPEPPAAIIPEQQETVIPEQPVLDPRIETDAQAARAMALAKRQALEKDNSIIYALELYNEGAQFEKSGEDQLRQGEFRTAQENFEKAEARYARVDEAKGIFERAERLYRAGQYEESLEEIQHFGARSGKLSELTNDVMVAKRTFENKIQNARQQLESGNLRNALALVNTLTEPEQKGFVAGQLRKEIVSRDQNPPVISHKELEKYKPDEPLEFKAVVEDNLAVGEVVLYYRRKDQKEFEKAQMPLSEDGSYSVSLPAEIHKKRELRYFFKATDTNSNTSNLGSAEDPFKIKADNRGFVAPIIP